MELLKNTIKITTDKKNTIILKVIGDGNAIALKYEGDIDIELSLTYNKWKICRNECKYCRSRISIKNTSEFTDLIKPEACIFYIDTSEEYVQLLNNTNNTLHINTTDKFELIGITKIGVKEIHSEDDKFTAISNASLMSAKFLDTA